MGRRLNRRGGRDVCEWCWHSEDDHEFDAYQRTPKKLDNGGFTCSDCASCELERPVTANA